MPTAARTRRTARKRVKTAVATEIDAEDRTRMGVLVGLCHRRWSLPILAELQKEVRPGGGGLGGGAKFVTLSNRLSLSRESLRDTLDDLIARDYLMRNPGVGHPMRPEYLLTEDGHDAAPHAAAIMRSLRARGLEDIALRKWSLPTLYAIGRGVRRFNLLKSLLPDVTPRALTLALKDLEEAGLVSRTVSNAYPPGVSYRLRASAKPLLQTLSRMRV
jgi:DNA-binding HxlR family transcriptional regulator